MATNFDRTNRRDTEVRKKRTRFNSTDGWDTKTKKIQGKINYDIIGNPT